MLINFMFEINVSANICRFYTDCRIAMLSFYMNLFFKGSLNRKCQNEAKVQQISYCSVNAQVYLYLYLKRYYIVFSYSFVI